MAPTHFVDACPGPQQSACKLALECKSVEFLTGEEVELKEGDQAELWATLRGAFHLENAFN